MIDARTFRDVMAQWPSGVTVVTTLDADGAPHGMTASSFSSVSLDPPLVSICLTTTLYSHSLIADSGVFGISILAKNQTDVGRRFAGMEAGVTDRFAGEPWTTAETGVPLLETALGWVDCRIVHTYPGGDHTIFVGEVLAGSAAGRSAPLLFHSRGWGQFADVLPHAAALADTGLLATPAHTANHPTLANQVAASGVRVRVPDLAMAALDGALPPLSSALVADRAGADRALAAGAAVVEVELDPAVVTEVGVAVSSFAGIEERTVVHLRDAFAAESFDAVLAAVAALSPAGIAEIGLSDEGGRATPLQVRHLLQEVVALARPVPVRLRLHDRDRLGLVKALTALKSGVCHFDTTLAGLDGAVATEDLVRLLEEMEVDVDIDTAGLLALAGRLRDGADRQVASTPVLLPPASSDAAEIVGAVG
jgi:flavin reductase (DIM6/NTAB) family NADH-FMN oxidoreductase RutF